MPTFSVDQIVDKTLIAKKPVPIKRLPLDTAPTVYTVKPGETVGVVYSWVSRDGSIWWEYYDSNKNAYYTKHEPGTYDIKSLEAQGTISLEQQQDETKKDESPVTYYLDKLTTPLVWGIVLYMGVKIYKELK